MQFFAAILAIAATASAAAVGNVEKRASICGSALDTPQCCETDVDGLLDLTCSDPSGNPSTPAALVSACNATGLTAECCLLPVLGEALVCEEVEA